ALLRRRRLDHRTGNRFVRIVGGVTVDLEHDSVMVDGRRVALTTSEFKILALLASEPGATFSRRQIMEHLWASSFTADEHTCEVHISSLRRKIEPSVGRRPQRLVTLRGIGYSLNAV